MSNDFSGKIEYWQYVSICSTQARSAACVKNTWLGRRESKSGLKVTIKTEILDSLVSPTLRKLTVGNSTSYGVEGS